MITTKDFIERHVVGYPDLLKRGFAPAMAGENILYFINRFCNYKKASGRILPGEESTYLKAYEKYRNEEHEEEHEEDPFPTESSPQGLREQVKQKPSRPGVSFVSEDVLNNYRSIWEESAKKLTSNVTSKVIDIGKRSPTYKTYTSGIDGTVYKSFTDEFGTIEEQDNDLIEPPISKQKLNYGSLPPYFTSPTKVETSTTSESTEKEMFSRLLKNPISPSYLYLNIDPFTFQTEVYLLLNENFKTLTGKYIKIVKTDDGFELKLITKKEHVSIVNRGSSLHYNRLTHLFFDFLNWKNAAHQDDFDTNGTRFPKTGDERFPISVNRELTEASDFRSVAKIVINEQEYNIYTNNIYETSLALKEEVVDLILNYKYPKDKVIRVGCEILYKDQKFKVLETYDHSPNLFLVEDDNKKQQVIKRSKKTPIEKL